jgi:MFS family permease
VCGTNRFPEHYFRISIFAGLILALLFVPSIGDKYGRKSMFSLSFVLSLFAQFGLLITESYEWALFLVFLMGFACPGKFLVGLMYILDFYPHS